MWLQELYWLLTRPLAVSAQNTLPLAGLIATPPYGELKLAPTPVPSANVAVPLPARELTIPIGFNTRILLL